MLFWRNSAEVRGVGADEAPTVTRKMTSIRDEEAFLLRGTLSWIKLGLCIGLAERQRWNWEVKEGKLLELEVRLGLCLGFRDHGFGSNRAISCFTASLLREWWLDLCIISFTSSLLEFGHYLPSSSSSLCQGMYFILWCKCRYIYMYFVYMQICVWCAHIKAWNLKLKAIKLGIDPSSFTLNPQTATCD